MLQEAKDLFEKAKAKPEIQELLRLEEKAELDRQSLIEDKKEEGRQESENNKAREVAIKMLKKGKPMDEIIEFTDLTKDQINDIIKEQKSGAL